MTIDGVWICNRIYWNLKQLVTTNNYDSLTELHTPKIIVTTTHIKSSIFTNRCLVAASKGGRFPSSGFKNSTRPQYQLLTSHSYQVTLSRLTRKQSLRVRITLWLEVYRQSVLDANWVLAVIVLIQHPLWREDGSVVYNCCWPLPAQWFSGSSPARLMTIFYCLRFETPSTWRAKSPYLYPPGTGWPSYIPRHWVPFSSQGYGGGIRTRLNTRSDSQSKSKSLCDWRSVNQ
jgi:hypothetical protein